MEYGIFLWLEQCVVKYISRCLMNFLFVFLTSPPKDKKNPTINNRVTMELVTCACGVVGKGA